LIPSPKLLQREFVVTSTLFANRFAFLAFNADTGAILAHGGSAFHAIQIADLANSETSIRVMHAGLAGEVIWNTQTAYALAAVFVGVPDRSASVSK
jgi:hypothetical protein